MRAKILVLSLIFLLALSSISTAFIDMHREPTLAKEEVITYKFLDDVYTIKALFMTSSGQGEALVELNGKRYTILGGIPETYADMQIFIKDLTQEELTLNLYWTDEGKEPDEKISIARYSKTDVKSKGKLFKISLANVDPVKEKITVNVNDDDYTLQEGDRVVLKDGSVIKAKTITSLAVNSVLHLWVSDSDIYTYEEEVVEEEVSESIFVNRKVGQNQKDSFKSQGKKIITRVMIIENDQADMQINGKNYTVKQSDVLDVDGMIVTIKSLTEFSTPAVLLLTYEIPVAKKPVVKEKEETEDLEEEVEDMEEELEEIEEVQDDMEEIDDIAQEEIPVVEEIKDTPPAPEKEYKDYTFAESLNWILNQFLGLFR